MNNQMLNSQKKTKKNYKENKMIINCLYLKI